MGGRDPCGFHVVVRWSLESEGQELWKEITIYLELGLEHGDSHWKSLDEKKTMVPSRRGIEMIEKKKNFTAPSLKRVLRGLDVLHEPLILYLLLKITYIQYLKFKKEKEK